jgi:MATE family multidrug resistance protein
VALRHVIPLIFINAGTAEADATVAIAAGLLLIGATFFVVDGLQTVAAGALRGLNDTRVPMVIAAISFWLIGFVSCYVLAFPLHLGVNGIWIGFTVGLLVYAVLLLWRFDALTRRGFLPDMVHAPTH